MHEKGLGKKIWRSEGEREELQSSKKKNRENNNNDQQEQQGVECSRSFFGLWLHISAKSAAEPRNLIAPPLSPFPFPLSPP